MPEGCIKDLKPGTFDDDLQIAQVVIKEAL